MPEDRSTPALMGDLIESVTQLVRKEIQLFRAEMGEKLVTLDGVERELAAEDLLLCDGDVPIALAGVMGGTNSEVTTETRSILLESANFDPRSIRRTSRTFPPTPSPCTAPGSRIA